jgi:hypothetical protein
MGYAGPKRIIWLLSGWKTAASQTETGEIHACEPRGNDAHILGKQACTFNRAPMNMPVHSHMKPMTVPLPGLLDFRAACFNRRSSESFYAEP